MKKLLFFLLVLTSFKTFAGPCTLSLYMPGLKYETADYQQQVKNLLKQKRFKVVEDQDFARADYKGQFLLEFVTDGVFRFQEVAQMSLYQGKNPYTIRHRSSKRTWGGDSYEAYFSLLSGLPSCQ